MKNLCLLLLAAATCFVQSADWATPAEKSNYRTTPTYAETMAYVHRIAAAAPRQVKVFSFGKTGEGRDLIAVAVSKDGIFDPARLHAAGRPIVLIQNSIHAGEMDGKDSCLALLRDMVVTKSRAALLDRAVPVIIPIYNIDGHERRSPYNRINQNGPEEMGWRVNAQNQNLNRDYVKAEAPETRAFLQLWNQWLPDFFVDDHVTDGADYQYDVTFGLTSEPGQDPAIAQWEHEVVRPYLEKSVSAAPGHLAGPFIFLKDDHDPSKGIERFSTSPRYADGYVLLQNRPGMLVEMHMLKDYKTRVTGNYEILRALLELVNRDADKLTAMNRAADQAQVAAGKSGGSFVLRTEPSKETVPFLYKTFKYTVTPSDVSGQPWIQYTHEPLDIEVPRPARLDPAYSVTIPRAYIVPAEWTSVIRVLEAQGVKLSRTTALWTGDVETYRCSKLSWQERPFEGHHPVSSSNFGGDKFPGDCTPVRERVTYPAGSVVVPMDQRGAKIAVEWLEPLAPDSAVVWNYFDTVFEQKEYAEDYVLEKLARDMMAKDPALKSEFEAKVASDKQFAANPRARLEWFYDRSPWYAIQRVGLYPVGRLTSLDGVPLK